jgi:hypothetical protein
MVALIYQLTMSPQEKKLVCNKASFAENAMIARSLLAAAIVFACGAAESKTRTYQLTYTGKPLRVWPGKDPELLGPIPGATYITIQYQFPASQAGSCITTKPTYWIDGANTDAPLAAKLYEYDPTCSSFNVCTNSSGHQIGDWGIRLYYDVHHTGGGVYFLAASSSQIFDPR